MQKKHYKLGMHAALFVALSLFGAAQVWARPTVVTTTTQVTDMVKEIAGDTIEVIGLMGPGVDPHLYKPSVRDVSKLRGADAVFYSGLMLEGRIADLLMKMGQRGGKVFAVTANIPKDKLLGSRNYAGHADPHVWFDANLWVTGIDVVVAGLSELDSERAYLFAKRGAELRSRYLQVHAWALQQVQRIPESQRVLITSHDAFSYFGRAFGFEVIGVQGISTASEAGLADVAHMVDIIKQRNVRAIFVESSVSPAAIERISHDADVQIGGELFSDAMGTPGQMVHGPDGDAYDTGTWEGMIRHNIYTLVGALKSSDITAKSP